MHFLQNIHWKLIMQVVFYKSSLCPRCHHTGKILRQLAAERADLEIETVDILASPARALTDGVRMIPAIRADNRLLSALFLGRGKIIAFLDQIRT